MKGMPLVGGGRGCPYKGNQGNIGEANVGGQGALVDTGGGRGGIAGAMAICFGAGGGS